MSGMKYSVQHVAITSNAASANGSRSMSPRTIVASPPRSSRAWRSTGSRHIQTDGTNAGKARSDRFEQPPGAESEFADPRAVVHDFRDRQDEALDHQRRVGRIAADDVKIPGATRRVGET